MVRIGMFVKHEEGVEERERCPTQRGLKPFNALQSRALNPMPSTVFLCSPFVWEAS